MYILANTWEFECNYIPDIIHLDIVHLKYQHYLQYSYYHNGTIHYS